MVADFAAGNAPNGHLDESTRNAIIEGVRNGDMTAVLKRYEEDIRVRTLLFMLNEFKHSAFC